jgi:hypothetical protein
MKTTTHMVAVFKTPTTSDSNGKGPLTKTVQYRPAPISALKKTTNKKWVYKTPKKDPVHNDSGAIGGRKVGGGAKGGGEKGGGTNEGCVKGGSGATGGGAKGDGAKGCRANDAKKYDLLINS